MASTATSSPTVPETRMNGTSSPAFCSIFNAASPVKRGIE